MLVSFKHNRLHVGYRLRSYAKVWYEPITKQRISKNGGNDERVLFRDSRGTSDDEPRDCEIVWEALYDPKNCEANNPKGRNELQTEFMLDAYGYMRERDPQRLLKREAAFQSKWHGAPRPQCWLEQAKPVKARMMRDKERKKRSGLSEDSEDSEDDEDDEDSAYDSVEGTPQTTTKERNMPPPPKPAYSNRKRKPANDGEQGIGQKRARLSVQYALSRSSGTTGLQHHFMSGGLGASTPSSAHRSQSRIVSPPFGNGNNQAYVEDDNDSEDDVSLDFIPGHPEPLNVNATGTQRRSHTSSPASTHGRGDGSQQNGIPLIHGWDRTRASGRNGSQDGNSQFIGDSGIGMRQVLNEQDVRRGRAAEFNGEDVDEEEAMRRAIRDSMPPEQRDRGLSANSHNVAHDVRHSIEGSPEEPIVIADGDAVAATIGEGEDQGLSAVNTDINNDPEHGTTAENED